MWTRITGIEGNVILIHESESLSIKDNPFLVLIRVSQLRRGGRDLLPRQEVFDVVFVHR